jgi:hypothetical protein
MINLFFDCEFTKLQEPLDPEPNELISIGCISKSGERFYAENSCYQVEHCSEFVIETVLPLLQGNDYLMHYSMIAKQLRTWIESFDDGTEEQNVKMWSDAPYWDWQHVKHMFDNYGWPANLKREAVHLTFPSSIQATRFKAAVEDAFRSFEPKLRRHHALDDAIANRYGFQRATARRF